MARTDNINNFLTDVAEAIREKKGTTEAITASSFDEEIRNLPSGGSDAGVSDYFTEVYSSTTTGNYARVSNMIKKIPSMTVNTGDISYLFYNVPNLEEIEPFNFTVPITKTDSLYASSFNLKNHQTIDMTNVITANSMFSSAYFMKKAAVTGTTNNLTSATNMFMYCTSLEEEADMDTSKMTSLQNFYNGCYNLKSIKKIDSSNSTSFYGLITCSKNYTNNKYFPNKTFNSLLEEIAELDASKCVNVYNMFGWHPNFTTFGGLKNLGMAYLTSKNANDTNYMLSVINCTALTYESLMNICNKLHDIASAGVKTQRLQIGTTNLEKLQATEEGQQAIIDVTNKGWTVS